MSSDETPITAHEIAKMIDHSLLRPYLTDAELQEGLELSIKYDVASACIKPCDVLETTKRLEGTQVLVCAVVGFPHGSHARETKLFETKLALDAGADEIDVVMNIGKWKSGSVAYVERELRAIVEEVASQSGLTKVILENSYLTQDEIRQACVVCERVGADFVKNGTGYGASSSVVENIALMRASVSPQIGVKVAGGVRTLDQLLDFRRAGATRVGTRATEEILLEANNRFG